MNGSYSGEPGHPNIPQAAGSGTRAYLGSFGFESVTDGSSNTALFSEALIGISGFVPVQPGDRPNSLRVSYQLSLNMSWDQNDPTSALAFVQACKAVPSTQQPTNPTQWSGACWNGDHAGTLHFNAYNHFNTPNGLSCVAANSWGGPPGGLNDAITANSLHPAGVNVCFTDGTVRFVKDTVNVQTWWAIGTRSLGEVLSADQY
jgi:hypothetical protein